MIYTLSQDWSNTVAKGDGLQIIKDCFDYPTYIVARSDACAREFCQRLYEQGEDRAKDILDLMTENASKETLDKLANAYFAFKQMELITEESVELLTDEAESLIEDILDAESDGVMSVQEFLEVLLDYEDEDEDGNNHVVINEIVAVLERYEY